MKKIVMIVAQNNFRDEEFLEPKEVFEKNGIGVKVASTSTIEARGSMGAVVKPDILVSDVKVEDFDALILVGGTGASQYWDDPLTHKLVQDAVSKDKVVAAICVAPITLARAGVLKGKRATVFYSEAAEIESRGADYSAAGVERDGKIVTGAGPQYSRKFAEEVIEALKQ